MNSMCYYILEILRQRSNGMSECKGGEMESSEILSQYGKNSDKIYKMKKAKYEV